MILENIMILFFLLVCMLFTWWWFVRIVNWSMGFNLKEIYEAIYQEPLAAAILRVGIMLSTAYLVSEGFGRIV